MNSVIEYLDELFPNPRCELNYNNIRENYKINETLRRDTKSYRMFMHILKIMEIKL